MWVRIRLDRSKVKRHTEGTTRKPGRRSSQQPQLEVLEDRQLLTATLQAIPNLQVPAQQGYTVPLLADTGATNPQTFTVTSSNPDIAASIIQGQFWTLGVSYTDPATPANNFTGTLTFELFSDLTPNTVKMINQFTNDGYYVNTGKYFPRIVTNFGGTTFYVVQGGSRDADRKRQQRAAGYAVRQRKPPATAAFGRQSDLRWPTAAAPTATTPSSSSTPARSTRSSATATRSSASCSPGRPRSGR